MNDVAVRGVVARIDWGYFAAAAINNFTVRRRRQSDTRFRLTAVVVAFDAFKLSQKPLIFVAPTKKAEWRWRIDRFDFDRKAMRLTAEMTALPDALR